MTLLDPLPVQDLLHRASAAFTERFGAEPTHAVRAPGRVNLIGEHTDYNDGFVLPVALDRETLIVGRLNKFKYCRVAALDIEGEQVAFAPDHTLAPTPGHWANYVKGVVAQFIAHGHGVPCFDAAITSTVPVGSGLSSSAALGVATATLLEQLTGVPLDPLDKARWCQRAEHAFAGTPCGIMDMLIASIARRGHAALIDCRTESWSHAPIDTSAVTILVADSSVRHELSGGQYAQRRRECEAAVAVLRQRFGEHIRALRDAQLNQVEQVSGELGDTVFRRARHVIAENSRVPMAADALSRADYATFGFLMNESHRSLRDDFQVSCPEVDVLVDLAQKFPGVHGSRMTGGGFGGCTVTLVRPQNAQHLADHLQSEYAARTGLTATCFPAHPSDAAGPVTF